jgi:hypothetical protein
MLGTISRPDSDRACADGDRSYIARAYYVDGTNQLQTHDFDITQVYFRHNRMKLDALEASALRGINSSTGEGSKTKIRMNALAALAVLRVCYEHNDARFEYGRAHIFIHAGVQDIYRKESEGLSYDDEGLGTFTYSADDKDSPRLLVMLPFAAESERAIPVIQAAPKSTVYVARHNDTVLVTPEYAAY